MSFSGGSTEDQKSPTPIPAASAPGIGETITISKTPVNKETIVIKGADQTEDKSKTEEDKSNIEDKSKTEEDKSNIEDKSKTENQSKTENKPNIDDKTITDDKSKTEDMKQEGGFCIFAFACQHIKM